MDSSFFRVTTNPDYYTGLSPYQAAKTAEKTAVSPRITVPSPDSRFPGWAAPMEDGRLITDYRPHCNENIPAGSQFPVKEWIQQNTDAIIATSRLRQTQMAGAQYGLDKTVVPPPVAVVKCEPTECAMFPTDAVNGIGTERVYDKAPELFGTFEFPRERAPRPHVGLNQRFEGGRNSPRGRSFVPMGNKPVGATEYLW